MYQRAVVTGGAGFIGSHVVDELSTAGVDVLVVDNFSTGKPEHLEASRRTGRVSVVEGDIRNADDLKAIRRFEPNVVFHMAAIHFIPYCIAHPKETLSVNVAGLLCTLRSVSESPLESFVFPSSGAAYGFSEEAADEHAACNPTDIYGLSKWLDEQVIEQEYIARPDVRFVMGRLFNAYGPRETNPHVLPEILKRMKSRDTIELGNLWPKRDLIYVKDIAKALVMAADGDPGLEVFNVGTGVGTSIGEVIESIEEITGESLNVTQVPERMRDGDGHLISDPTKLMGIGWKPEYVLDMGLRELLEEEGLR